MLSSLVSAQLSAADEAAPEIGDIHESQACGPLGRWWLSPTVELGWTKSQHLPTTVLNSTGGRVYGNENLGTPFRAGVGLSLGTWVDEELTRGIDASLYYFSTGSTDFTLFSPGTEPLLLPVMVGGQPWYYELAGSTAGNGAYQSFSETKYQTADVSMRRLFACGDDFRVDALVGFRYAHLGEGLHLYTKQIDAAGSLRRTKDHFSTANHFFAGQIGLAGEYRFNRWYVNATGKLAFGYVSTTANAEGAFRVNGVVDPYGFYTRPAISGERSESNFAVMPTVNLALGRQLGEHGRIFVGYAFQYLSRVARPEGIFDPAPEWVGSGTSHPIAFSSFWVQSVNLGLEWRY